MLSNYLWRQRIKFEATLAFSMLEPWEKLLFTADEISYRNFAVVILTFFTLLVVSGLCRYLPAHVSIMRERAAYYLFGQDGDDRMLRHLVDHSTLKEL
ncbi:hypothetical protein JVU11DRAFT_4165 [Chiua virens]|nr:hypothetical protein JVU11DRAFT_4165 [Chiua virens]